MFRHMVTTESELRELLGSPSQRAIKKDVAVLDEHCRAFIARSPFLLLATASAKGRCDVSPKGDAPGFVRVLDDRHLVIPDRPGNRRLDGMKNLLQNAHVGTIFLIPGREETLRVNGRASIVRDAEILESLTAHDKRPLVAIGVEVFHEGATQMRRVLGHVLGETPTRADSDELIDVPTRVEERLRTVEWVEDVRVRLREEGTVFFAEVFVVPGADGVSVDDVVAVQELARSVDDQLVDVTVMPVATLAGDPHHRGPR